jgi:hypothetical protein
MTLHTAGPAQDLPPGWIDFGPGLGHWQDLTDDGYERIARKYRRALEDHADGLGAGLAMSTDAIRAHLAQVEKIQAKRAALRTVYHAQDGGSRSTADFAFVDIDEKPGVREPLTDLMPGWGLAAFFDWERHLRGETTALDWEQTA